MDNDKQWLVPLTGLAAILLGAVSIAVMGDTPDPTEENAREIIDFYADNEGALALSAILTAISASLFVFFGAHLRSVLRAAQPDPTGDFLPVVVLAGAVVFTTGLAIDATITLTLVETSDDIQPAAVQALSALYTNDFVPFAVGFQLVLLATGISVVKHGALPKWLGGIAILLAVIAATPAGFISFLGGMVFIAVISVMLAVRARRPAATPPAARTA
jgi:hypothetical protein